MTLPDGDPRHGTSTGYQYHRCRCETCRRYKRDYERQHRARRARETTCPQCGGPGGEHRDDVCRACYEHHRRTGRRRSQPAPTTAPSAAKSEHSELPIRYHVVAADGTPVDDGQRFYVLDYTADPDAHAVLLEYARRIRDRGDREHAASLTNELIAAGRPQGRT